MHGPGCRINRQDFCDFQLQPPPNLASDRLLSGIINGFDGAPEEIRTPDPQIRSLVLYPAELRARDGPQVNGHRKPILEPAANETAT